jgi:hypothetical protein
MSHAIVKAKLVARKKIREENRILENTAMFGVTFGLADEVGKCRE